MPGLPRATYMPFPFQIVQSPQNVLFAYEYASANRVVNMGKPTEAPVDSWMGWSNGKWEGDTLVVDVTGLNGNAWLDRAGNYTTDSTHVVERYTLTDADHINYEATIEDAKLFTRPWKISTVLYKHMEKNFQLLEFKCVEFVRRAALRPPAQEVLSRPDGILRPERRTENVERTTRNVEYQNARRKMQKRAGSPFCVFRFAFFVCTLASMAAACASRPPLPELRRVELPDLSRATPPVREQLREGYAALKSSEDAKDTTPAALGEAYGRMGMLLMAAEFRNEAESAFLNAQTLAPEQLRWPYYLGHLYRIKGDAPNGRRRRSSGRERCRPDDVPTLVWLGEAPCSTRESPMPPSRMFPKALSLQPRLVVAAVRARARGARAAGLRARRGSAGAGAVARPEGDRRSLSAGARVPRARRRCQGCKRTCSSAGTLADQA